jgi:hypothetical protein
VRPQGLVKFKKITSSLQYCKFTCYLCFWRVKCGWCVGLTTLPPCVSRLSRQCGILNISQPYRARRPVTGIALLIAKYNRCYLRHSAKRFTNSVLNTSTSKSKSINSKAFCYIMSFRPILLLTGHSPSSF